MILEQIKVGMKVVPYSKSIGDSFNSFKQNYNWKERKPYLYVVKIGLIYFHDRVIQNGITLNEEKNNFNGYYFLAEDFEPYKEGDVNMKFWEILRDWENGWRGIAIDSANNEWNFKTGELKFPENTDNNVVTYIREEWNIKDEKSEKETQLENLVAKLQCQLTEAQLELKEIRQK